ncbi:wasp actin nucleation-promoting factor a-related [Anaeramoeba flamelloides]|uniref:Wasp actin nucleation-promoting factor a-related n=1 Tax=Anaeramoeba flamelloides TaxID=1746091 RepID=A0AAV7YXY2_9EUKA|nr:wasp actin nucleation-promoting factor a-related [Anaeramoeba flamelloides]KAJ6242215.1 wasp actin nucleation-promoting factor a-related [Anaeramoeba flamelloides]
MLSTSLLSSEELKKIKDLVSPDYLITYSVARLYFTEDDLVDWIYSGIMGAVLAVQTETSAYIKIVDLVTYKVKFEHEIYFDMNYKTYLGFVHVWESHDCVFALSFADDDDAAKFKDNIERMIPSKKKKKNQKKRGEKGVSVSEPTQIKHQGHVGLDKTGEFTGTLLKDLQDGKIDNKLGNKK